MKKRKQKPALQAAPPTIVNIIIPQFVLPRGTTVHNPMNCKFVEGGYE